jgi:hypothetical protein
MSNPSNILSDFRTYSYHQFLIATDGMNAAQSLGEQDDVVLFNRDTRNTNERFSPRFLGPGDTLGYVVLIDGMKDVQFFIKSAKWETILSPNRSIGGQQYADTIEVDGKLEIVEPFGIRLLEVLSNVSRDLATDPTGLIFVLKTVFVGVRDDGSEEIISNVRPFLFTMTDITAIIDTGGATYTMELVGVTNGTAKLPQISRIADGINLEVGAEGSHTIKQAMEQLEAQLNNKYRVFRENLDNQFKNSNITNVGVDDFREVRYKIKPIAAYLGEEYIVGDNVNIAEQNQAGVSIVAAGANATVEQTIRRIMDSSNRVAKDATGKNTGGTKYLYKIVSTLLPDDEDMLVVEYSIHRYQVIVQHVGQPLDPNIGEFIEFDYIFTGKNIDVLEFDIKMDMGLSFFYTIATSKTLASDQETAIRGQTNDSMSQGSNGSSNGTADTTAVSVGQKRKRLRTPLFLGATMKDPMIRNKLNPLDSATFDSLLSTHAAYENIEAQMKIAGNPQLLDELLPTPAEISRGGTEPAGVGTTGTQSFLNTPSLIKVNIRFPTTNELDNFQDFWYQGFYNLHSVTQNFSGGLFTQDIIMFSIPQTEGVEEALSTQPNNQPSTKSPATQTSTNDATNRTAAEATTSTAPRGTP